MIEDTEFRASRRAVLWTGVGALAATLIPASSCKLVDGKIDPKGWCQLYAPKPK